MATLGLLWILILFYPGGERLLIFGFPDKETCNRRAVEIVQTPDNDLSAQCVDGENFPKPEIGEKI